MDSIQISDLLYILKRRLVWLILAAVVGGGAAWVYTEYYITPKYASSISLYVYNSQKVEGSSVTVGDMNAAQQLVNTYIVILQNEAVLQEVCNNLSVPMSVRQLNSYISMSSEKNTEVFKIVAITTDPNLSAEICNKIAEIAPDILIRVVKAGAVEKINTAIPATEQYSPDITKNTALGVFAAPVILYIIFLLIYMFDDTIKGEADLKKHVDIAIITEIPNFGKLIHRGKK